MISRKDASLYGAVALGGTIGAVLRALASMALMVTAEPSFPWGTLFVNVTGSFAIGFYAALTGPEGRVRASPWQRHFVMTGFCGGYTTFSAFSLETLQLIQAGDLRLATLNIAASIVLWLATVWLGHELAMRLKLHPFA